MDSPEVLADEVQNNEHLYLLNAIPEDGVNENVTTDTISTLKTMKIHNRNKVNEYEGNGVQHIAYN